MGGIGMKVRLKNGEVLNIASYYRITLESCDGWGNPIEVDWKDVKQILDDDGYPLGMSKFPEGRIIELHPDIDWETRRYEIAKAMLPVTSEWKDIYGHRVMVGEAAIAAVAYADALIEELKK